ncbi:hypothetical protein AB1N83_012218, partial [Pleurotus pulmonarius]
MSWSRLTSLYTRTTSSAPQAKEPSYSSQSAKEPRNTTVKSSRTVTPKSSPHEPELDVNNSGGEVLIAVMGATGTGKTTFINMASGSTLRVGSGLMSCTNAVQASRPFPLDG